jgi:hypothetical protein
MRDCAANVFRPPSFFLLLRRPHGLGAVGFIFLPLRGELSR